MVAGYFSEMTEAQYACYKILVYNNSLNPIRETKQHIRITTGKGNPVLLAQMSTYSATDLITSLLRVQLIWIHNEKRQGDMSSRTE